MSWLKTTSLSFARQLSRSLDPRHDYEPQACYNSFCKHWQQAYDIILKSQPGHLHDDVLGVVNHLEQLGTLMVLEARARELGDVNPAACLDHLLSENLMDKLYEWAALTGKYENAVRLEQLRLFGSLISHYSSQVIAAEPFLRPLLKLLSGFRNELPPSNVESQLVTVLNQLCVALIQNIQFVDLFFLTTHTQNGSQAEFIIVRLLLSSVHREGATGAAARDALLLCANMSARHAPLAKCILEGNTCPILATGLSGLYSLLPRTLAASVRRLTPDDVNHVHKLTLFIDSLEFCNAVAQVAHPSIKKHLLDLLYQGFLVPVLGPALLQLALVSLSLMETLVDLNCEDVMLELVFKYLLNGSHVMLNYRHKIADPQQYREAAVAFSSLSPRCCGRSVAKTRQWVDELAASGRRILEYRREEDVRRLNGVNGDVAMNSLVQEKFNYGNPNETLYGNFHSYLCDARFEIVSRILACSSWSSKYDAIASPKPIPRETNNNKETKEIDAQKESDAQLVKEQDSLISVCTSGYDTLKTSDTSEKEHHSLSSLIEIDEKSEGKSSDGKDPDSLLSIGESSDYDSFRWKLEETDNEEGFAEVSFLKSLVKIDSPMREYVGEVPLVRSWRASTESIIGPLLSCLLKKSAALLECEVSVNCAVSGAVSRLAALPAPLLACLLLGPAGRLQPNVPSLFQILRKLKEEVDELTSAVDSAGELVDKARVFLIHREMTLVNVRPTHNDDGNAHPESPKTDESLFRKEPKRRSLSTSLSNMFHRKPPTSPQQSHSLQAYQTSPKRPIFIEESYWNQSITLRSVLNAVILDEWVKELSALCEEHALRLSTEHYEDTAYIRTVGL